LSPHTLNESLEMLYLLIVFKLSAGHDAIICSIMITDLRAVILEVSEQNSLDQIFFLALYEMDKKN